MYVKLTAKPDTWFKEGSEVFWEDSSYVDRRMTLAEYTQLLGSGFASSVFFGRHVCEDSPNERALGLIPGEERLDGEVCGLDEFEMELVDEPKIFHEGLV